MGKFKMTKPKQTNHSHLSKSNEIDTSDKSPQDKALGKSPCSPVGDNAKPFCLEDKSFYHETRTEFKCNKRYFEHDIKRALADAIKELEKLFFGNELNFRINNVLEVLVKHFGKSLMPSSISSDTEKECSDDN